VNNESVIDPLVRARVTKLREDKGWTQAHLARAAEVATNTVGGLEGDRHTRPAQLTRIAAALQVSLQALRTGAGLDENPFTKKLKLSDEDLRMAKRFHDAETEIRLATLRLLAAGRHDPMFTLWTRLQSLDETRRDFLLKALSEYEEALAREKAEKANRRMKKKR
jgi:transcriptional regulator with XRE-family HTH domain